VAGKEEDSAMKWMPISAVPFMVLLALAGSARAGLYNPRELQDLYPIPASPNQFQFKLSDLRGLANKDTMYGKAGNETDASQKNEWIAEYRQRFEELRAIEKTSNLTLADCIELSACYLRLPSPEGSLMTQEAIRVLESAKAMEPRNFMVLANLAVAYQLAGNLELAVRFEELALEAWPDAHPAFTAEQLRWFRRAEKFYYLLLKLRMGEMGPQPRAEQRAVDDLFSPVDLVRADRPYEVGRISPRQMAELPPDAVPIVEQLLFWLPLDNRLYWLLAELLNAKGDVPAAFQIFNTLANPPVQPLINQPIQPRLLLEHWRILLKDPRSKEDPTNIDPPTATPAADKSATNWLPDLRAIAVGFVAGVVVTLLAGLQLREIHRRREMRAGSPPSGAG
jgi:tetratricopeptide (TPR) repeat protein